MDRRLQHLHFLFASRRRTVPRRVDVEQTFVERGSHDLQRHDPCMFHDQYCRRRLVGRVFPSLVGIVHVRDLSDDQFEGYQLRAEIRTRRCCRRHSVLHVSLGGAGAARDGRSE